MSVYADSSFIVALYMQDSHSAAALERMKENTRLFFTPFHGAECVHAIVSQVFYKKASIRQTDEVLEALQRDRTAGLFVETAMPENVYQLCADLARRHGPKLGMRTLDSLHVACALELKAERFWTFDERQAKLARGLGIKDR